MQVARRRDLRYFGAVRVERSVKAQVRRNPMDWCPPILLRGITFERRSEGELVAWVNTKTSWVTVDDSFGYGNPTRAEGICESRPFTVNLPAIALPREQTIPQMDG